MRATRTGGGSVSFGQSYGLARPVAYTPVVTWTGNTITTQSGFYLKTPGKLEVWVSFVETVGTAAAIITITIPTGYTAVTMAGSLGAGVGFLCNSANSTSVGFLAAAGATTQIASSNASTSGVVGTWSGYFSVPTLT